MKAEHITQAYQVAKERYAAIGVAVSYTHNRAHQTTE